MLLLPLLALLAFGAALLLLHAVALTALLLLPKPAAAALSSGPGDSVLQLLMSETPVSLLSSELLRCSTLTAFLQRLLCCTL
jgi:hypothetical protein